MSFWNAVRRVLAEADIILLVLDARMPELTRNREIEEKVLRSSKELVLVFNKIDLVSPQVLKKLRQDHIDYFFVSARNNIGVSRLKRGLLIMAKGIRISDPKIGIVGYPNVGKSAIINALAHRARAQVAHYAGTTKGIQWVKAGSLKILDSPGVIPFEDKEERLAVIGAKNPEKLKNPERVALHLVRDLIIKNKSSLEKSYGIKIEDNTEEYDIIVQIGKKRGFLVRGGGIDFKKTCLSLIRDWQRGKVLV